MDDSRGLFLCAVEVMLPPSATPWRSEGGSQVGGAEAMKTAAGTGAGTGAVENEQEEEEAVAGMIANDEDGDGEVHEDGAGDDDDDKDLTGWLRISIEDPSKFAERLALEHDKPSP